MAKAQLVHALQEGLPCCVIDGRGENSRKKQPLADAIAYRPDLKIEPTAAVVVVADNDRLAQKIAGELDAAYPGKRIIAVQGGVGVWEAALVAASQAAAQTPGFSFVIPKNTCESGTPLQQLKSGLIRN
jgi:hypothetical protein